eukprot:SAG31_NODE_27585_length_423_cov_1.429012_1_plen_27_part_10
MVPTSQLVIALILLRYLLLSRQCNVQK